MPSSRKPPWFWQKGGFPPLFAHAFAFPPDRASMAAPPSAFLLKPAPMCTPTYTAEQRLRGAITGAARGTGLELGALVGIMMSPAFAGLATASAAIARLPNRYRFVMNAPWKP